MDVHTCLHTRLSNVHVMGDRVVIHVLGCARAPKAPPANLRLNFREGFFFFKTHRDPTCTTVTTPAGEIKNTYVLQFALHRHIGLAVLTIPFMPLLSKHISKGSLLVQPPPGCKSIVKACRPHNVLLGFLVDSLAGGLLTA
jgi:hypothetical protein